MAFADKGIAAMNAAFWSSIGSRLASLSMPSADDPSDPAALHSESSWLDDATQLGDPMLAQLMAYWRASRRAAAMPPAEAIDPFALRFALGHLVLLEPTQEGADFKVRLYGTQLASRVGYDLTGKLLSSIEDPYVRRGTEQAAARVLFAARPLLVLRRRRLANRSVDYTCLFLPFGDTTPSRIIIGISYAD